LPTGLRASGHDNVQTRDHTRVEELRCLSGQRAELDQVAKPRRLDDELADVDSVEASRDAVEHDMQPMARGQHRVDER
jgi:hypothetical protein